MMGHMGALDSLDNGLLLYLCIFLLYASYRSMLPICKATCVLPNTYMLRLCHSELKGLSHIWIFLHLVAPSCLRSSRCCFFWKLHELAGLKGHKLPDSYKWSDTFPLCARLSTWCTARKSHCHFGWYMLSNCEFHLQGEALQRFSSPMQRSNAAQRSFSITESQAQAVCTWFALHPL